MDSSPPTVGIFRPEYWSGLPFTTRRDPPDPGIEPESFVSPVLAGGFFTTALPGKPLSISYMVTYMSGEGNGTPLQYSCLENPMDEGAWWAAVHGVAKSQT